MQISFSVRNTGKRTGQEVAQVYLSLPASAGEPPKRLIGWEKFEIQPGESKTVTLMLPLSTTVTVEKPAGLPPRRVVDITNPNSRAAAQRVIVALVDHVKDHPAVIKYQLDRETKYYDTSGPSVQVAFANWMRARYPDLAALNKEFGLDYGSNRINRWEDFPSVNGSINATQPRNGIERSRQEPNARFQKARRVRG